MPISAQKPTSEPKPTPASKPTQAQRPVPALRTNQIQRPVLAAGTKQMQRPVPAPRPNKVISAINSCVKQALTEVKKTFDWTKTKAMDLGSFFNKNLNDLINWTKKPSVPKPKHSLSDYVEQELNE